MFGHKILLEVKSSYSGLLRIYSDFGYKYISTGALTQTGGLVKDVWQPVLQKIGQKNASWLILGLAGGTAAGMIAKKFNPTRIVGVDIDPVMVNLGKQYLGLTKIPKLEIVIADAQKYLKTSSDHFDFILVDMYLGDQLPTFVYDPKFLKKLRESGRIVVFNHLFYDDSKKAATEKLIATLKNIFPQTSLIRKLSNILIVCS